ncbi:MAG TPA: hypothetical protein VJ455_00260 [Ignavibacteria bacterium]|nr:hypothetical protein [Ignavibacteria bacterium]
MKQHEAVIFALEKLGGVATLGQLNIEVMKIPNCKWGTKTPFASIRRIVQTRPNEIYKIKPGLYGLISYKSKNEAKGYIEETKSTKQTKEFNEFNHTYYQGLIATVGNLRKFNTYIPNQDKNKSYIGTKLGNISSLKIIPQFSFPQIVKRSATIDVIWFNERYLPHSLFEVEHSTDIVNSLIKFNDLQDFSTRMIIVADSKRKREYENKIKFSVFKDINNRIKFLEYESLIKQYESLLLQQSFETLI